MPLVDPGPLHRVALAVSDDITGGGGSDLEGTDIRMFRVGGYTFILLAKGAAGGPVARFLERYGPGLHSLAWEIKDMWTAQNLLIEAGVRIGSVNIPGRHFFMHPKDTHGLLLEWTDDNFGGNARRGDEGGGTLDVSSVAWVTAVVDDAEATAAFLADLAGASPVTGNPAGPPDEELTLDVAVGDLTIRLVTPRQPSSRFAQVEASPRLCSLTWKVGDLDRALASLQAVGVATVSRSEGLAVTDPAATFGIPFEWTA
jgi:methylmalonyl-CoA/ethylmalonyl-CoA epimerase